jgi:hypothetical protein
VGPADAERASATVIGLGPAACAGCGQVPIAGGVHAVVL